jgi:hypothetical protein
MVIEYRKYVGNDMIPKITNELARIGQKLPNLMLPCIAWTAEDETGKILRVAVLQSVPIVEPFNSTCEEGEDGFMTRNLFKLVHEFAAENRIPRLFMHPDHPAMKRIMEHVGGKDTNQDWMEWRPEWEDSKKEGVCV